MSEIQKENPINEAYIIIGNTFQTENIIDEYDLARKIQFKEKIQNSKFLTDKEKTEINNFLDNPSAENANKLKEDGIKDNLFKERTLNMYINLRGRMKRIITNEEYKNIKSGEHLEFNKISKSMKDLIDENGEENFRAANELANNIFLKNKGIGDKQGDKIAEYNADYFVTMITVFLTTPKYRKAIKNIQQKYRFYKKKKEMLKNSQEIEKIIKKKKINYFSFFSKKANNKNNNNKFLAANVSIYNLINNTTTLDKKKSRNEKISYIINYKENFRNKSLRKELTEKDLENLTEKQIDELRDYVEQDKKIYLLKLITKKILEEKKTNKNKNINIDQLIENFLNSVEIKAQFNLDDNEIKNFNSKFGTELAGIITSLQTNKILSSQKNMLTKIFYNMEEISKNNLTIIRRTIKNVRNLSTFEKDGKKLNKDITSEINKQYFNADKKTIENKQQEIDAKHREIELKEGEISKEIGEDIDITKIKVCTYYVVKNDDGEYYYVDNEGVERNLKEYIKNCQKGEKKQLNDEEIVTLIESLLIDDKITNSKKIDIITGDNNTFPPIEFLNKYQKLKPLYHRKQELNQELNDLKIELFTMNGEEVQITTNHGIVGGGQFITIDRDKLKLRNSTILKTNEFLEVLHERINELPQNEKKSTILKTALNNNNQFEKKTINDNKESLLNNVKFDDTQKKEIIKILTETYDKEIKRLEEKRDGKLDYSFEDESELNALKVKRGKLENLINEEDFILDISIDLLSILKDDNYATKNNYFSKEQIKQFGTLINFPNEDLFKKIKILQNDNTKKAAIEEFTKIYLTKIIEDKKINESMIEKRQELYKLLEQEKINEQDYYNSIKELEKVEKRQKELNNILYENNKMLIQAFVEKEQKQTIENPNFKNPFSNFSTNCEVVRTSLKETLDKYLKGEIPKENYINLAQSFYPDTFKGFGDINTTKKFNNFGPLTTSTQLPNNSLPPLFEENFANGIINKIQAPNQSVPPTFGDHNMAPSLPDETNKFLTVNGLAQVGNDLNKSIQAKVDKIIQQ